MTIEEPAMRKIDEITDYDLDEDMPGTSDSDSTAGSGTLDSGDTSKTEDTEMEEEKKKKKKKKSLKVITPTRRSDRLQAKMSAGGSV
jgi:stringent starvation protein B